MSAPDNGGPAFPTLGRQLESEGMTLRDYFAAKAMVATAYTNPSFSPDEIAECAYEQADAMLKARQQ